MAAKLTTIGVDADDTLWQNEQFFRLTQERFAELLAEFAPADDLAAQLLIAEKRNLGRYGFGIKGFMLSMIEVAIDVTNGSVPGAVIGDIIAAGQEMLTHPIELLPHARTAIENLAGDFRILLITKGDLLDQERKLAQSGLGGLFDGVEIVSHKTSAAYHDIFDRHGDGAKASMMVGNSLRSDVNPVLQAGGWGVFIPHALTWALERDDTPQDNDRFFEISNLGELPNLVAKVSS